jgi:hypothetical protein
MIAARRRAQLVGPALLVLLLGAFGLAAKRQPASDQPSPLFPSLPARPVHLAPPSAAGCPISFADQLKSVKAFAEMMPVFRHPRCTNCHGGLDIMSDQHPGADQLDADNDPRALMNPEQRDAVSNTQCQTCHDNIRRMNHPSGSGGWMIPPRPMFFVDEGGSPKSDEEMCRLMKRMEKPGESFVSHIRDDHETIQFIEAGFAGDRALGEGLQDYDGLSVQPPPGTQGELTNKATKWVEAIGEGYESSPDCGCVKPDVELTMKSDILGTAPGGSMTSQATATVRLERDSTGMIYRGNAPLVHGPNAVQPIPAGCQASYAPSEGALDIKEVRVEVPDDGTMTIDLLVQPTNSGGNMTLTCPKLGSFNVPLMPFSQNWRYAHERDRQELHYHVKDFEIATGGSGEGRALIGSKDVTRSVRREGVTITATTKFELWALPPE